MSEYIPTIGLEIHAELNTETKMFCNSKNDPDEVRPNVNICPICMGHPGALPTINRAAVKHVLRVGQAVGGRLADYTEFDRKNYFYPDIPKGYQISQYKYPLVSGGSIKGVELTRIHLEEDTARSSHVGDESLVDFNRSSVPLMELVTEPVIHDAKTASDFAKELQLILQYLGAGEANMEKGEMRVEANISISKTSEFGTKVEVKNLNSFRAVERAIEFEIKRQAALLDKGEKVVQETRGWDENAEKTFSQRSKEDAHDYRYFPDPDLPKLKLSLLDDLSAAAIAAEIPELPQARRERYSALGAGLTEKEIEFLVTRPDISMFFDSAAGGVGAEIARSVASFILSEIPALSSNKEASFAESLGKITADNLKSVALMKQRGDISSRGVKDILKILYAKGGDPEVVAKEHNLIQVEDAGALLEMAQSIVAGNEAAVAEYKAGKESALQFLVGQGMKLSKGSANPQKLREAILDVIK